MFVEFVAPPLPLVIFGAGHDALPLVAFATQLGWHVTVADGRPTHAQRHRFPAADEVLLLPRHDPLAALTIDAESIVVVMTHNFPQDVAPAARPPADSSALSRPARLATTCRPACLPRSAAPIAVHDLHAPVGLDIGADTPELIALAVVAEIQAALSGREGGKMRLRRGSDPRTGRGARVAPPRRRRRSSTRSAPSRPAMADVAAVLLAAGGSQRMGSPKQLLLHRGQPLVARAAAVLLASACRPVLVVLGAHATGARAALAGLPVDFVDNPRWAAGVGTSIAAGIAAAAAHGVTGAVLALADQAPVGAGDARSAARRATGRRAAAIVASRYAGTVGVPAYFAAEVFPRLLALAPDQGCKRSASSPPASTPPTSTVPRPSSTSTPRRTIGSC